MAIQFVSQASAELKELYKQALLTRDKSHSPYSGFKVGSAIRLTNGKVYSGCNVENASYGGTICAERVAIQNAVSDQGPIELKEILVLTESQPSWPPCGLCRQVISEFGSNPTVYLADLNGKLETLSFSDIFPRAFSPKNLNK